MDEHEAARLRTVRDFRPASVEGERCWCGAMAEHKVEEVIFPDDPFPIRHPFTRYICRPHFVQLMGPAASRLYGFDLPTRTG